MNDMKFKIWNKIIKDKDLTVTGSLIALSAIALCNILNLNDTVIQSIIQFVIHLIVYGFIAIPIYLNTKE